MDGPMESYFILRPRYCSVRLIKPSLTFSILPWRLICKGRSIIAVPVTRTAKMRILTLILMKEKRPLVSFSSLSRPGKTSIPSFSDRFGAASEHRVTLYHNYIAIFSRFQFKIRHYCISYINNIPSL